MVNNLQSKNMCVQLQETQLYVNVESQNKAHIWLACKQMLQYLHWTILSPVFFRVMNEKLHYNFTALDNLMDLLWENKLIPGKSSSVSSSHVCLTILCNHQIEPLLVSFAKADFDQNSFFLLLAFTSCPCKWKQCKKSIIRALKTTQMLLHCLQQQSEMYQLENEIS